MECLTSRTQQIRTADKVNIVPVLHHDGCSRQMLVISCAVDKLDGLLLTRFRRSTWRHFLLICKRTELRSGIPTCRASMAICWPEYERVTLLLLCTAARIHAAWLPCTLQCIAAHTNAAGWPAVSAQQSTHMLHDGPAVQSNTHPLHRGPLTHTHTHTRLAATHLRERCNHRAEKLGLAAVQPPAQHGHFVIWPEQPRCLPEPGAALHACCSSCPSVLAVPAHELMGPPLPHPCRLHHQRPDPPRMQHRLSLPHLLPAPNTAGPLCCPLLCLVQLPALPRTTTPGPLARCLQILPCCCGPEKLLHQHHRGPHPQPWLGGWESHQNTALHSAACPGAGAKWQLALERVLWLEEMEGWGGCT